MLKSWYYSILSLFYFNTFCIFDWSNPNPPFSCKSGTAVTSVRVPATSKLSRRHGCVLRPGRLMCFLRHRRFFPDGPGFFIHSENGSILFHEQLYKSMMFSVEACAHLVVWVCSGFLLYCKIAQYCLTLSLPMEILPKKDNIQNSWQELKPLWYWYSLESTHWELSSEYSCFRVLSSFDNLFRFSKSHPFYLWSQRVNEQL